VVVVVVREEGHGRVDGDHEEDSDNAEGQSQRALLLRRDTRTVSAPMALNNVSHALR
jgi:hypothetical protein